jgi:Fur family peroxide stress response transcriptional regulator
MFTINFFGYIKDWEDGCRMKVSVETLMDIFKNKGIRPSYTRVRIMEYLAANRSHPTADEIYGSLVGEIPTLSKTTVYNSMNAFVEAGLARVITIEDNEVRYDADISDHGHFKCTRCGRIYDFPVDMAALHPKGLSGFKVSQRDVYFKGTCPGCLDNK